MTCPQNCTTCPAWSEWSSCSVTCGSGTKSRTRTCTGPSSNCPEESEQTSCDTGLTCDVDCDTDCYTWGSWSSCSATCDGGTSTRERVCSLTAQSVCSSSENKNCGTETCPPNTCTPCPGSNGEWTEWGQCSKTCGGGIQNRFRMLCGPNCDPEEQLRVCSTDSCDGCTTCDDCCDSWSSWGYCSATCGGSQSRTRSCGLYVNCQDSESKVCFSAPCVFLTKNCCRRENAWVKLIEALNPHNFVAEQYENLKNL